MTPEEFVAQVNKFVVENNMAAYEKMYADLALNSDTSENGKKIYSLFSKLDPSEREVFFSIIKTVIIDTVSTMFSILDGDALLDNQEGDFVLTTAGNPGTKLNVDLWAYFGELRENE